MNENENLVPKRRFKEFTNTGTWEQRKLGDLAEVRTGKAFSSADFNDDGEYLVVTNKNIQDDMNGIASVGDRIDISEETILNNYLLKGNNILVTMDGVNIGKTGKYSNEKSVLAQRVGRLNSEQLEFIYQVTNDNKFLTEMNKLSVGNAIKHISLKQISDYSFAAPINEEEQNKIGTFFEQLDTTIALHQRKLDKSKQLKLSYLSEMFPVEGECKPKRRFIGFTDDWEQRKLIDVCSIITKQTGFDYSATIKPSLIRSKMANTYPFIQNKDFSGFNINTNTDFFIPTSIAEKFPKIILDVPSLLVTISGNIGNVGFYDKKDRSFIGGAVGICKLKDPEQGAFIIYELESEFGQKQFKRTTKTSSHANITVETIKNLNILFPKNHSEYIKIGSFFKRLDETIALHQHKLEKLKNIKQAYLNEMFV